MDTLYLRSAYVPAELRAEPRWLPWKRFGRKKVPVDHRGKPCDPHDPAHWQSFAEAIGPYYRETHGVSGVGYALDGSGIAVLDVDGCVDEQTGEVSVEARRLVDQFGSYAELSPSGTGMHQLVMATLPSGKQRPLWGDLIGSGFITVTGWPIIRAPIREGGEAWERFLGSLKPKPATLRPGQIEQLHGPPHADVDAVLARMMPNDKAQRLLAGDWSGYQSRSEADAALACIARRNGADESVIVAVLKTSKLPRDPRRDERYFASTAAFAIATANVRVPQWSGVSVPDPALDAENERRREAIKRIEQHPVLGSDAPMLVRFSAEVAGCLERSEDADHDGFRQISPARVSGDYPSRDGLPPPKRLMSRQGCLKAWKRLERMGLLDLRSGTERKVWWDAQGRKQSAEVKVTLVRVDGHDFVSILDGFAARLASGTEESPNPVYVTRLETRFHNAGESVQNGVAA